MARKPGRNPTTQHCSLVSFPIMEGKEQDPFFLHLAQQNFDQCRDLKGALGRYLCCYEEFYLAFTWAKIPDSNRLTVLEALEDQIRRIHSPVLTHLLPILRTRGHLCDIYRVLLTKNSPPNLEITLNLLAQELKSVTMATLFPYRDTCLCETQVLERELAASKAISEGNFYAAMVTMTQLRQRLRQWELIFIYKKYTPNGQNSKLHYNEIYTWHIAYFQNLLEKTTLYFAEELKNMVDAEMVKYGLEVKTWYAISRIENAGFREFYLLRVKEKTAKCMYMHPRQSEAFLPSEIVELVEGRGKEKVQKRRVEEDMWVVLLVEAEVYMCVRSHDDCSDRVVGVVTRLSNPVP